MEVLSSRLLLRPTDLDRSIAFYRDRLGLAVYREFGEGDHRGVVFFVGGGFLEVSGRGTPAGGMALWLQVRDLDATWAGLDPEVPRLRGPQTEPWGLREAWIADPDDLRIGLIEVPADHPLRRR